MTNPSLLIQSAQRGDLDSFNQIVLKYQDRLFNIAVCMLENQAAAEDAVQNAFILAFRNLANFRGGCFDFWLLRILKNVCYDELRRRKRQVTCALDPLLDDDEEFESPLWLVDHAQNPVGQVEAAELGAAIRAGLQSLPPAYRMVITLVDVDGFDYSEAAQVVGVPIGTIKSRLARARLQLRQALLRTAELLPEAYSSANLFLAPRIMMAG